GQLEEAEKLEQAMSEFKTKTFENSHPDTVVVMFNPAATFWKSEKQKKAEKLHQEVLKFRKKTSENSHPDILRAMFNLAAKFREGGKLEE
ncbi:hypothetical protein C0993_005495, partial [Termitomyces sp. T159_Od127]